MAIEKIKKLFIISNNIHRDALLEALQNLGAVQIEDLGAGTEKGEDSQQKAADLDPDQIRILSQGEAGLLPERRTLEKGYNDVLNALLFLKQYIPERSGWELLRKGPDSITMEEQKRILAAFDFEHAISHLHDSESQVKRLHARRLTLENRRENLSPWKNLDLPLSYLCRTNHVIIRALCVPVSCMEACRKAAEEAIENLFTAKLSETKVNKYIIVIFHKDSQAIADKIMQDFDVHPAVLPCDDKTPAQLIMEIEREIADVDEETRKLEKHLQDMREDLIRLKVIADNLNNSLERKKIRELCGETRSTFVIRGWIPAKKIPRLHKTLQSIDPDIDLTLFDPEEGEEVPILLDNPALIRPFETVINIYGRPNYWEFDPTPSVALFFFIGFGYCLADAGYGMMLTLLSLWAVWKLKLTPGVRKFLLLMALSGISSTIVGVLTGGWFGNLFTGPDLPTARLGLGPLLSRLQWIDPLRKHIMLFLQAALIIGYIQLFWGVILRLLNHIMKGRLLDALLDPLPCLLFAGGLAVMALDLKIGLGISGFGLVLLVIFTARSERNPVKRIGAGLWVVYGVVTGLLSDVLSYCRLFALGLASGIMATVINIICFFFWKIPIPVVGWVLTIILLILAHTFNLALNILGAFIHTARLQFVEFFPKFYANGGRKFESFEMKRTYIAIKDETI